MTIEFMETKGKVNIDELVTQKNFQLLKHHTLKATLGGPDSTQYAKKAALLEGEIAEYFLAEGNTEEATINLMSQGSLLVEIGADNEAKSVFDRVKQLTSNQKIREMCDKIFNREEVKNQDVQE